MAHRRRPVGVRDARRRRWLVHPRALRDRRHKAGRRHYDDSRTWFRAEDDFPGPRTMADGRVVAARPGATRTTGGCCSSTSSIRTSRSTRPSRGRRCTTTSLGRRPPDLAAVHRRRASPRRADRAPGPPDPGELRRQAVDDRPLVRSGARRHSTRSDSWDTTAVIVCTDHGHYLGDVRRAGRRRWRGDRHLGQAGRPAVRAAGPHPTARRTGRASPAGDVDALTTNVDLHATIADIFGVEARAPHPRPLDGAAARRRGRRRSATGR